MIINEKIVSIVDFFEYLLEGLELAEANQIKDEREIIEFDFLVVRIGFEDFSHFIVFLLIVEVKEAVFFMVE